jgi:hypothetical protein
MKDSGWENCKGNCLFFSSSQMLAIINSNKGKLGYYFVLGSQLQQYAISFDMDFAGLYML